MSDDNNAKRELIRKLLAKANDASVTPQEATLFAEKAAELAILHGIDMASLRKGETLPGIEMGVAALRSMPADRPALVMLGQAVSLLYGCKYIIRAVGKNAKQTDHHFIGRPHLVELCNHWMLRLWDVAKRDSKAFVEGRGIIDPREAYKARNTFHKAFGATIYNRMKKKREEMEQSGIDARQGTSSSPSVGGGTALVVASWYQDEEKAVTLWTEQNMKLHQVKRSTTNLKHYDPNAAAGGMESGKRASLADALPSGPTKQDDRVSNKSAGRLTAA